MRFLPILFLACAASFPATAGAAQTYAWDDVERVYAIGDIHGAYPELIALLQGNGIIDDNLNWQAGTTHVVSLGDMLDRGAESRRVMDLFMLLEQQAQAAGGAFHVLLGNHELMNLSGDLRDVSDAELNAFEGLAGHRAAFASSGPYGSWLKTLPAMIRINDSVFLHGGLSPLMAGRDLEDINARLSAQVDFLLAAGARHIADGIVANNVDLLALPEETPVAPDLRALRAEPLFGPWGPLWYRGNALCHNVIENPNVDARLQQFDVTRIVIAHTPTRTREVTTRFGGAVTMIDTGMLQSFYGGKPRLLEVSPDGLRALGPNGEAHPITNAATPGDDFDNENSRFVRLGKTARRRALAAYRLDRLLGVHMVPTTTETQVDGRDGILLAEPARMLSEAERAERGIYRPNECYRTSAYELLAAFDALAGMRSRGADNLFYALPGWKIVLGDTQETFGSSASLPNYAAPPKLPQGFAEAMRGLSIEQLEKEFDGLLKKNEIRALMKRRDAILTWPRSGLADGS